MPFFKKACFKIDLEKLTKYQLYLWQWVEIELRYQRFIKTNSIKKHIEIKTEDLSDPDKITRLFKYFNIEQTAAIKPVPPKNTNISQGKPETVVHPQDTYEFKEFLEIYK